MVLPEVATMAKEQIDSESIAELRRTAARMCGLVESDNTPAKDDLEILKERLCFRPISKTGLPIIGRVSNKDLDVSIGEEGGAKVWVAGGHGPWGISMALGTGVVFSDLLAGKKPRVDVSALGIGSAHRTSKL